MIQTQSAEIEELAKRLEQVEQAARRTKRTARWWSVLISLGLVSLIPAFAWTASIPNPSFQMGDPISSAEINANFQALVDQLTAAEERSVPPGTIVAFAGVAEPVGWMLCDGRVLNRADYLELFGAIGTSHGGSGGTFNIPDYRGAFLRGVAAGSLNDPDRDTRVAMNLGGNTGDAVGSIQAAEFAAHDHGGQTGISVRFGGAFSTPLDVVPGSSCMSYDLVASSNCAPGSGIQDHFHAVVSDGGSETRPLNAYVNWLIKY